MEAVVERGLSVVGQQVGVGEEVDMGKWWAT